MGRLGRYRRHHYDLDQTTGNVKSALQQRAEDLATAFKRQGRKPVVIEFAGTPKAGKTTSLGTLHSFLKRCGFRVEVVVERASICPIRDKKHSNFNIWTACTTLAQILEKTQSPPRADDPDVLILDRGIFDAIAWLQMMENLARIRHEEREAAERFLLLPDWRKRITGVIVMTASPAEAMRREQGDLPVEGSDGSIMNEAVLEKFKSNADAACRRLRDQFRIFELNTSVQGSDRKKTAERVADIVLGLIAEQLEEEILCLPRTEAIKIFANRSFVQAAQARELLQSFGARGDYQPRAKVEASTTLVQALPVVVVRNKSGDVLLLRRREKHSDNALHNRVVVWAGGHVRREDAANGHSIEQGAVRELHEELRLSLTPQSLSLLGAMHVDFGGSIAKHIALVYEWRAESDDVAVVLSNSEFYERGGTSLSGKFVKLAELQSGWSKFSEKSEPWSECIIQELLENHGTPRELKLL